jgi:hypothetical protein
MFRRANVVVLCSFSIMLASDWNAHQIFRLVCHGMVWTGRLEMKLNTSRTAEQTCRCERERIKHPVASYHSGKASLKDKLCGSQIWRQTMNKSFGPAC